MTGITEFRLAELEALANAATPGPWLHKDEDDSCMGPHVWSDDDAGRWVVDEWQVLEPDAAFIAASRQAVPDLIAALRDAWAERDYLNLRERAINEESIQRDQRLNEVRAERLALTAQVERVRALADEWEAEIDEHSKAAEYGIAEGLRVGMNSLRAALEADA